MRLHTELSSSAVYDALQRARDKGRITHTIPKRMELTRQEER